MVMHHWNGADGSRPIITGVGISFNSSGRSQRESSEDNSSGSEGESIYPGIFSKIKKLKAKQLRNILTKLFRHYGIKCTIEALVEEALRGGEVGDETRI
uniref:Uncharacterized protein n=1 Tax=viral metagenome TaxID=1070528 RepID=A0A6H1ZTG9_9ZZZZ